MMKLFSGLKFWPSFCIVGLGEGKQLLTYNLLVAMMKKVALCSCLHFEVAMQYTQCSVECNSEVVVFVPYSK